MFRSLRERVTLNNRVQMPWVGLGLYKVRPGEEVERVVQQALELGYHHFDTAAAYGNEEGVGRAVRNSGVPREDVFITTKVSNDRQGYGSTLEAFEESLERLGTDYIDLYLIHWPVPGKYVDTWRALERLHDEGRIKAIGVSNFEIHHLRDVMDAGSVTPAVNQIEFHPYLTQGALVSFCKNEGIRPVAWSPLCRGKLLKEPVIQKIAERHGKNEAQVVLRWDLEKGVATIPKTVREERMRNNANLFDFDLSQDEVAQIDALNKNERIGPHPDQIDF
ncbi:aldo/keto reductase [Desmospora profundinema]|uniref:Diketogulonate reductase-like aldo/keto reductase n=1 Tax=Desmospora profundinema TaxID=1571184 RepID=A0ABU1INM2_9BACL|nr:aldo/keto reductase [Desmospora profundinema]MDR6226381.1 diketogulonate reductase-like aldo/keto reductase [Desmospora profundinema]